MDYRAVDMELADGKTKIRSTSPSSVQKDFNHEPHYPFFTAAIALAIL